ncbi:hypothetical protein [Porticoccus sp.]
MLYSLLFALLITLSSLVSAKSLPGIFPDDQPSSEHHSVLVKFSFDDHDEPLLSLAEELSLSVAPFPELVAEAHGSPPQSAIYQLNGIRAPPH